MEPGSSEAVRGLVEWLVVLTLWRVSYLRESIGSLVDHSRPRYTESLA